MSRDELLALAERVMALTGPDREADARIAGKAYAPAYTASIDAAMTLVPEGWNWMAGERNQGLCRAYVENDKPAFVGFSSQKNPKRIWHEVTAATPALALTAAALLARAEGDA